MLELNTQLRIAYRRLSRSIDTALRKHGLTFAKYEVLAVLVDSDEPVTLVPLSDYLRRHWTTTSATVDRLEHQGMAARRPNPANRRQVLIDVTQGGRAAHARATSALRSLAEGVDAPYPADRSPGDPKFGPDPVLVQALTLAENHDQGLGLFNDPAARMSCATTRQTVECGGDLIEEENSP
ncbi:MarR family winged helix-turn-helix transcriptional regulator [Rhodococcus jostii]|nr:MarR family transcriptional regulator [Rhodococcus jostii]